MRLFYLFGLSKCGIKKEIWNSRNKNFFDFDNFFLLSIFSFSVFIFSFTIFLLFFSFSSSPFSLMLLLLLSVLYVLNYLCRVNITLFFRSRSFARSFFSNNDKDYFKFFYDIWKIFYFLFRKDKHKVQNFSGCWCVSKSKSNKKIKSTLLFCYLLKRKTREIQILSHFWDDFVTFCRQKIRNIAMLTQEVKW